MKKILAVIAMIIAGCVAASALTFTTSDLKSENLKGNVKRVKTYRLSKQRSFPQDTIAKYQRLKMPLPEYKRSLWRTAEYNDKGMMTFEDRWFKEYKTYDPQNDRTLIAILEKRYDEDGSLRRVYEQTFDEDWLLSSGKATDGNGDVIFTESYKKTLREDGKIELYGNHVGSNGSESSFTLLLRPDYTIEQMYQKAPLFEQLILMDEQERPFSVTETKNGTVTKMTMEYTPTSRKIYNIDPEGKKTLFREFTMDSYGNVISEKEFKPNGFVDKMKTTTYKYDSHGNWIRSTTISAPSSETEIKEREIEYY